MKRKYELVYIASPDATEAQIADLHTQVEAIVQRLNGTIQKTENWGRRKLAYEIASHKEGTYVLEVIDGDVDMEAFHHFLLVVDLRGAAGGQQLSSAVSITLKHSCGMP